MKAIILIFFLMILIITIGCDGPVKTEKRLLNGEYVKFHKNHIVCCGTNWVVVTNHPIEIEGMFRVVTENEDGEHVIGINSRPIQIGTTVNFHKLQYLQRSSVGEGWKEILIVEPLP